MEAILPHDPRALLRRGKGRSTARVFAAGNQAARLAADPALQFQVGQGGGPPGGRGRRAWPAAPLPPPGRRRSGRGSGHAAARCRAGPWEGVGGASGRASCWGTGVLSPRGGVAQDLQHIAGAAHQAGAVAQQQVAARGPGLEGVAGHCQDLPPLVEGVAGRVQRAGFRCRLHHPPRRGPGRRPRRLRRGKCRCAGASPGGCSVRHRPSAAMRSARRRFSNG